jgi:hypothetical protein
MSKFTNEQKAKETEREVKMRKSVYARSGMNPTEAKYKIEIMEEIAAEYARLAEGDRLV